MKKIFLLIAMVVLSSCATSYSASYSTSYVMGDVTLMNDDGAVMRSYPNSILEQHDITGSSYSIKNGGMLNFQDANGDSHLIGGGIICVDNLRVVAEEKSVSISIVSEQDRLIDNIQSLDMEIRRMTKQIKNERKNGGDTSEMEKALEEKETERTKLADLLWEKYHTTPYAI